KGQEPQNQAPKGAPAPPVDTGQAAPLGSALGFYAASELVDTQALPAWLKAQEQAPSPTAGVPTTTGTSEARPSSSKMAPMPAGFSSQQTGGFSAAELVDTKALPTWLKDAGPQAGSQSAPGGQNAPERSAEDRMAAAELVDTGVLPV